MDPLATGKRDQHSCVPGGTYGRVSRDFVKEDVPEDEVRLSRKSVWAMHMRSYIAQIETGKNSSMVSDGLPALWSAISEVIDKPKVVSRSQSQKLMTWFSLKSQCPTTPTPGKVSKKQDRAILPK